MYVRQDIHSEDMIKVHIFSLPDQYHINRALKARKNPKLDQCPNDY